MIDSYVLDNRALIQRRRVLDLGSGCGASAIASKMAGASHVIANDIDQGKSTTTIVSSLRLVFIQMRCLQLVIMLD